MVEKGRLASLWDAAARDPESLGKTPIMAVSPVSLIVTDNGFTYAHPGNAWSNSGRDMTMWYVLRERSARTPNF